MPSAFTSTAARLRRLVALDTAVFDEVRLDARATAPAVVVAAASLFLYGLGGWLWWVTSGLGDRPTVFLKTAVLGTAFSGALWVAWLVVATAVLQRLTGLPLRVEQLVRAAGFACWPLALGPLMAVPSVSFGVGLFLLGAWVVATNEALASVAGRRGGAVALANLAGFGAWVVVMSLLSTGANQIGPGPFLAESIWDAIASANVIFQVTG
ncbi:MAG: hypothetical protein AMXMBFR23_21690 [Chloroflexota bacterium]